jgi:hypothetical protein
MKPWVGVIHELPLPRVSYLNQATPKYPVRPSGQILDVTKISDWIDKAQHETLLCSTQPELTLIQ